MDIWVYLQKGINWLLTNNRLHIPLIKLAKKYMTNSIEIH